MAIEIVPYTPERSAAVAEFNRRMKAGGTTWGWYEQALDDWIPPRAGVKVWREHYVAIEDQTSVRGAFALKPQEWRIRGEVRTVADWQGPVSEGLVSPKYSMLGLRLVRDMLRRQPLLYSWGHGGHEANMLQMLRTLGWLLHETPFCLRVVAPFRFLRLNRYLRSTPARRLALDALAFSGAGSVGLRAMHLALRLRSPGGPRARAEQIGSFGPWADELWERCAPRYLALGLRDSATMNALVPAGRWPHGIVLRVFRGEETIGWAVVLDTRLRDDARFGKLRVGSVVDCLAAPEDARAVVQCADRFLRGRGVDIVISNQAHPAWVRAFEQNGYLILARRRTFAASPELQAALEPVGETLAGLHLTNMDGHGPMGL